MKIVNYILCSFLLLCFGCANENPIEKEQYFKQIYLVGGQDYVFTTELDYSSTVQETFVSVACSGSLNAESDVEVILSVDPKVCSDYNANFLGEGKEDQFYKVLSSAKYEIPDPVGVIPAGEVYGRIPVRIVTETLHCDSSYAIPLRIDTATLYPVNNDIRTLLLGIKLKNAFSGDYEMTGTSDGQTISMHKTLKACGIRDVRMFYAMTREDEKTLIKDHSVVLHVNEDNSIIVSGWDLLEASGTGTYDPQSGNISVAYDIKVDDTITHIEENLRK